MPMSPYVANLRKHVGGALLLMPSAGAVIFDEAQRVLLMHSSEGGWVIPGGALDPGETPADACVREAWEETGLLVQPLRLIGTYGGPDHIITYKNGDRVAAIGSMFACRIAGGQAQADGVEALALRWFTQAEAMMANPDRWMVEVLRDAFAGGTHFQAPIWQPPA